MAVEVVERGETPEEVANRTYEVKCRHCKSWLKFKRADAVKVPDEPHEGQRAAPMRLISVECPVCKRQVVVTE